MKNPAWTREELILALDLYHRLDGRLEGEGHPEIVALSQTLNRLPAHASPSRTETFRNPSGVAMKLANLRANDPKHPGRGLARGNQLEAFIWQEFADNHEGLRKTAEAIKVGISEASLEPEPDPDEEFLEGDVLTRIHKARERKPEVVRKKKREVLARLGRLACEVCGFDFQIAYGDLGTGFAECHHRKPLASLPGRTSVRTADLAILCANCHRMIHKTRPTLDVPAFRSVVRSISR